MVVIIGERAYRTRDWSLTGVGLEDFDQEIRPGEVVSATLRLPMQGSRLELQQALRFTGQHGDVFGFEFHELRPRNRRILRHYVELAVEGKLDNVEDLIAVVTAPEVSTPIQEALNLADLDNEELISRFRFRSALTLVFAFLFLVLLLATLFYNTTYRVSGVGVITGNLTKVSAGTVGVVTQVMKQANQPVKAGEIIAYIADEKYDQQIALLEQRQIELRKKLALVETARAGITNALIDELEELVKTREKELNRARRLHRERLISFKDLAYIENQYRQARIALARERRQSETRQTSTLAEETSLKRALTELEKRLVELRRQGDIRPVVSPSSGLVFNTGIQKGQRVSAATTIALLQDDRAPYVLLSLPVESALKLSPGMKATVVVPRLRREYSATITALGYSAVNPEVTISQEASLNETLVKLTLDDPKVRLPAHLRVNVWVKTFSWRWLLPSP
ncbi:hypothetical protein EBS_1358 [endosymbiont of unidentified scaly snail isolate Monju]|nr:hypothetical protein EBS_1358 [endosymbiont of unidentified scaly snail isolate Monju]